MSMVFKRTSETLENKTSIIDIKNMELSQHHWTSVKEIKNFLENLEVLLPLTDEDKVNEFLTYVVKVVNEMPRILDVKFYRNKDDQNHFYMLTLTDINVVNKEKLDMLESSASFWLKHSGTSFTLYELPLAVTEKFKKNEIAIPANWNAEEDLTKKFNKYRKAFSVWE